MKAAGALLTFVCTCVTSSIALAFAQGGMSRTTSVAALIIGLAVGLAALFSIRPKFDPPMPSAMDVLLLAFFALASLRAFLWLLYIEADEWKILSPNNLGDIALHLDFIRYFASGVKFWPESPILAGTPLCYPLGTDLFNSQLLLLGLPVERGLIWVGLVGAGLTAWALWRWGGGFAIAAFLFAGGLMGFLVFATRSVEDFQAPLAWKNLFLSMFVTQRGLLYALPAGLFLLDGWRSDFFRSGSGVPRWIPFFLYATMPLFSVHAFLFLSITLLAIFLVQFSSWPRLIPFVLLAVLPSSAATYLVTGGFSTVGGLRLLPGWMQNDGTFHPVVFWVMNFGLTLPLLAVLGIRVFQVNDRSSRAFACAGLFTFLLCFFVAFAPWEWDNTKLLLWAWLGCAPALWLLVIKPLPPLPRAAICFVLFFSGAISLVGGLDARHGYKLTTRSELDAAAIALSVAKPGEIIAVDPNFNNPAMLLGHPVLCGYEGHLWSHGLPYHEKWDALHKILRQDKEWLALAQKFHVRWIYHPGTPPTPVPQP